MDDDLLRPPARRANHHAPVSHYKITVWEYDGGYARSRSRKGLPIPEYNPPNSDRYDAVVQACRPSIRHRLCSAPPTARPSVVSPLPRGKPSLDCAGLQAIGRWRIGVLR